MPYSFGNSIKTAGYKNVAGIESLAGELLYKTRCFAFKFEYERVDTIPRNHGGKVIADKVKELIEAALQ
jgi:hypothetical protein